GINRKGGLDMLGAAGPCCRDAGRGSKHAQHGPRRQHRHHGESPHGSLPQSCLVTRNFSLRAAGGYGLQPGGGGGSSRMGAPGGVRNVTMVWAPTEPSLRTMFSSAGPFSTKACPAV